MEKVSSILCDCEKIKELDWIPVLWQGRTTSGIGNREIWADDFAELALQFEDLTNCTPFESEVIEDKTTGVFNSPDFDKKSDEEIICEIAEHYGDFYDQSFYFKGELIAKSHGGDFTFTVF